MEVVRRMVDDDNETNLALALMENKTRSTGNLSSGVVFHIRFKQVGQEVSLLVLLLLVVAVAIAVVVVVVDCHCHCHCHLLLLVVETTTQRRRRWH